MALEVYTQIKPAHTRRTLLCSLILLFGTGLLGAQMTRDRGRALLEDRVQLPLLNCSIRPPDGATMTHPGVIPPWEVQPFHLVSPTNPGSFAVWHASLGDEKIDDRLAAEIFAELHPATGVGGVLPAGVRSRDVMVGPYDGVEIWNASTGVIVRVAGIPGQGYLALSMISDAPIEVWRTMFDRSCRTLQIIP